MRAPMIAVVFAGTLALGALAGCAPSTQGAIPGDFAVDYSFTNGSLPDHFQYTITLDSSGAGTYLYSTGYGDTAGDPTAFRASEDQLLDLYQEFADAGVFERSPGLSALPVGGANRHLTVTADGHQYDWDSGVGGGTSPVDEVYQAIEALAPR